MTMKVKDGETTDTFVISGTGTLHITILMENMRREGYEFMVGPPKVINKRVDDKLLEPFELIWDEIAESNGERDKMLLQLEEERLYVYNKKVDRDSKSRVQLLQTFFYVGIVSIHLKCSPF
ncbi:uncharacterized protein M6B38_123675 [Iris pallida]|uniref:Uncharacterized protein n=1 Tax=Iris pallida TaxID=29817 RepID=A0AAX6H2M2_IRIPA|nr:uncharacterized protein M6B38_123675 [Iris pallida]